MSGWDGKVVMSTPGGPIVEMSLGDLLARKDSEIERQRAEIERLRDVLRSVCVHPSGDRIVKISFISEGCTLTFPVVPSTTWSLEVMIEFDKARRKELEGKP